MCGVSAVLSLSSDHVDPSVIRRLHAPIHSRGPDGEGFFRDELVCLSHRRLAIIDTSDRSSQPFFWQERYVLVFNGEIYNYRELRQELCLLGHSFRTESDTEVLIAAYVEWGELCQDKFNGMWSFVIWDKELESLFCSRDRYGIKPLYWAYLDHQICFASEPKQLTSLGIGGFPNIDELSRYLYAGIVGYTSDTFFDGINCLPPGHSMKIDRFKSPLIEKWYHLPSGPSSYSSFRANFKDSIDLRLRSDVPVGSCLSGGLDSSAVVMQASSLLVSSVSEPLHCIHARSSDVEVDEFSYAQIVSEESSSLLTHIVPTVDQFWDSLREICYLQDEPFGSPSICMQYFVMKHARLLGLPVMLDGQGADEVLLGYSKYLVLALGKAWRDQGLLGVIRAILASCSSNSSLTPYSSLQYLLATMLSPLRSYRVQRRLSFVDLPIEPVRSLYQSVSRLAFDCKGTQLLELFRTSLPALLRYEDRNSMAHSVEARLPFLDFRLVESFVNAPVDQKIYHGWSKYPLRTSGILPSSIAWRKSKLGFNAPERSWLGSKSSQMLAICLDSSFIASILNRRYLEKSWYQLDRREQWRIFNVALWSDIYHMSI